MARYTAENTSMAGKPVRVWLDGSEMKDVTEADDELGFVVVLEGHEFVLKTGDVRVEITA